MIKVLLNLEVRSPSQGYMSQVSEKLAGGCVKGICKFRDRLIRSGFQDHIEKIEVDFVQVYSGNTPHLRLKLLMRAEAGCKGKEFTFEPTAGFNPDAPETVLSSEVECVLFEEAKKALNVMRRHFKEPLEALPTAI